MKEEIYQGYLLIQRIFYSRNAPEGREGWEAVRLTRTGGEWDHFCSPFASVDITKRAVDEVLALEGK